MEKSGFITRGINQESRRSDRIELTDQGRRYAKIWRKNYQDMEERMLKGFSDQEREQFAEYLLRSYQNFQNQKEEQVCETSNDC